MNLPFFLRFPILFLLFLSPGVFAQDYMDEIAKEACACLDQIPEQLDAEEYNMKLGFCMIEAALPFKKQLKKDHGVDMNKIDVEGEALGQLIALKMVGVCPEGLMKMADKVNEVDQQNDLNMLELKEYQGVISKVEDDQFVIFSVKNELGRNTKFYWLTFVESNIELSFKYKSLVDDLVKITYVSQEFYDARIGEYRIFNIIHSFDTLSGDINPSEKKASSMDLTTR